jgi:uncharacterized OB-fold protein
MSDIYIFGHCNKCGQYSYLKNGRCLKCNEDPDTDVPDFIQDLFKDKEN